MRIRWRRAISEPPGWLRAWVSQAAWLVGPGMEGAGEMGLARKAGLWDYVIYISFRIGLDQPGVIGPGAERSCLACQDVGDVGETDGPRPASSQCSDLISEDHR